MPKTARYRLQSLLHARVPWRVIDELEWLRRILPRSCSKPPKRDPIPQIRKKFILGNRIAQPLSCVHVRFCCLACKLMVARIVRLRMSVIREKRHQPPTNPLSLRARNEIDELLLAVHVELPIDIAPMGDGRSFRYHQFLLNAREGVSLGQNNENLKLPRGQAVFEGDVLAFRYERMVAPPFAGIGLRIGVLVRRSGCAR